ncbi:hypothetical protein [Trueperella pyogenes]|uniref:hypothetical protein n=2 Tax=Trueperella pyogenes TaxID=1661 RepID=UPI000D52ECCF|nr:hypothetical protein [Trueperella pyogenes]AWG03719.1 hypothetical protein DC090_04380 [Trueperella pyogenes]AWG16450.1 hypothetical protein DDE06_06310 [Trueperella pyogenes]AZR05330.1 hypothetical protein EBQ11_08910 [Trueperella pyogenes]MBB3025734.1 hypothetical protein [Trueperella pyogenes]QIU87257.1 hypothetical protein HEP79_08525 [Trueperella pyogenes]
MSMYLHPSFRKANVGVGLILVSALALVGCSSQAKPEPKVSAMSSEQWQHDFERCLEKQGVDLSNLVEGSGAKAGQDAKTQKALQTCVGKLGLGPQQSQSFDEEQLQSQLLTYARCMRESGYDLPDPKISGDGPITLELEPKNANPADIKRCGEKAGIGSILGVK